jgi:hypothetical protein
MMMPPFVKTSTGYFVWSGAFALAVFMVIVG